MATITSPKTGRIRRPTIPSNATTKYTVECILVNPETGINVIATFNVNADVAILLFNSVGAPAQWNLDVSSLRDVYGFEGYQRFDGIIGGNRIYLKTSKGVVIKGPIVGGPADAVSFTGAGTWTRA